MRKLTQLLIIMTFASLTLASCGATSEDPTYQTGDCVVVGADSSGNGIIQRASCQNPPPDYDKVLRVLDSTNIACTVGDRTFIDGTANKTYCLEDLYNMAAGSASGGS